MNITIRSSLHARLGCVGLLGALLCTPTATFAEPTLELYIRDAAEVFEGDPESTSLDALGHISSGPVLTELAAGFEHPVVSLLVSNRGQVFAGTAGGGLVRVQGKKAKVIAQFEGQVVSAMLMQGGKLHVATAPDGKIVSVNDRGAIKPVFVPKAKYVWAMLSDPKGLILATGAPGQVIQVKAGGKSTVLYDPAETHVRALIRHPKRGLVFGGGQKGIVYQLKGKTAFALYDSELEEVTALAFDPKTGDLYAALVSEDTKGSLEPSTWIGAVHDEVDDEASPIKSSEVVRILPSGHVEKVWTSKREGALALHFDAKSRQLYVATGASVKNKARIYTVDAKNRDRVSLLARLTPALATQITGNPKGGLIVGTAPAGKILQVGPKMRTKSTYLSVKQDLKRVSTVGRLWFDADAGANQVAIHIRTGNTADPDATWSKWSPAVKKPEGGNVSVSKGRYAQFKAELSAIGAKPPVLKSMHASVVRMNVAPKVLEVFMLRQGVHMRPLLAEGEKDRTVTLSKSVVKELRNPFHTAKKSTRVRQGERAGMMSVAWKAEDENHDGLLFRVQLRRLDGPAAKDGWRQVADDWAHEFHSFDSRALDDGHYQFRVIASDRPSNAPNEALTATGLSPRFIIDNRAPKVGRVSVEAKKSKALSLRIKATAQDAVSPLATAEFSLDGGPWLMLPAADGLIDSKSEAFAVELTAHDEPGAPKLTKGNHSVRVRVVDRAGNEASASGRLRL